MYVWKLFLNMKTLFTKGYQVYVQSCTNKCMLNMLTYMSLIHSIHGVWIRMLVEKHRQLIMTFSNISSDACHGAGRPNHSGNISSWSFVWSLAWKLELRMRLQFYTDDCNCLHKCVRWLGLSHLCKTFLYPLAGYKLEHVFVRTCWFCVNYGVYKLADGMPGTLPSSVSIEVSASLTRQRIGPWLTYFSIIPQCFMPTLHY